MTPALRAAAFLVALMGAGLCGAQPAKPTRVALVIGNGAYQHADALPNPPNDAADMAKALEASGFTVIRRQNVTLREMHLALREFGDSLGRQATGLFYFAGHGLQVRGHNYLLPVDADVAREDEVAFQALDVAAVMEKLDSARNPVNLVILDACRNNPFGARLQSTTRGLAPIDAPPGTLIAFATAPGSTAADGTGRNGLYTHHLVGEMARPGAPVEEVFKAVRANVRKESRSLQVPWESTSLESAFSFRQAAAPVAPPASTSVPRPAPGTAARNTTPQRAAPASIGAPPAFVVGDKWTYRIVNELDQSERQAVVRVSALSGDEVHYASGAISDTVGNFTRVVRSSERVETYKPSTRFYVFPLNPGSKWNLDSFQQVGERKFDLKIRLQVLAEEDVEVPAGRMRALRIEREARWKQRGNNAAGVSKWTYWYSSAVKRFVRAEETNVTTEGKVLTRNRHELVSHAVK
ncbi:MAG: caspase family protein [Usitatibacter sp.]